MKNCDFTVPIEQSCIGGGKCCRNDLSGGRDSLVCGNSFICSVQLIQGQRSDEVTHKLPTRRNLHKLLFQNTDLHLIITGDIKPLGTRYYAVREARSHLRIESKIVSKLTCSRDGVLKSLADILELCHAISIFLTECNRRKCQSQTTKKKQKIETHDEFTPKKKMRSQVNNRRSLDSLT